jgi:hypothetical protein
MENMSGIGRLETISVQFLEHLHLFSPTHLCLHSQDFSTDTFFNDARTQARICHSLSRLSRKNHPERVDLRWKALFAISMNTRNTPKRSSDAITYPLICERKNFIFDSSTGACFEKKRNTVSKSILCMLSPARALSIFAALSEQNPFLAGLGVVALLLCLLSIQSMSGNEKIMERVSRVIRHSYVFRAP